MHPKYKRMIRGMGAKEAAHGPQPDRRWVLYILRCQNDTFYTGVTNDIDRRLNMHNEGRASKYTRTRRPVRLVYYERCAGRGHALVRECKVKSLSRSGKETLIATCINPMAILRKGKNDG